MRTIGAQSEVTKIAQVPSSATVVTLAAANKSRAGLTITNESTAVLTVKLGATASQTDYTVKLGPTASGVPTTWDCPVNYTGIVTGLWASANGNAYVTEYL